MFLFFEHFLHAFAMLLSSSCFFELLQAEDSLLYSRRVPTNTKDSFVILVSYRSTAGCPTSALYFLNGDRVSIFQVLGSGKPGCRIPVWVASASEFAFLKLCSIEKAEAVAEAVASGIDRRTGSLGVVASRLKSNI